MIKTVLADDHKVFCDGLAKLLTDTQNFEIINKFHHGQDLLENIYDLPLDLLILDFQMPGLNCEEVIQRIRIVRQNLKIIVLSMHEESIYSKKVIMAGANAYLTKSIDSETLIESIIKTMNNEEIKTRNLPVKSKSILSKQEMAIVKMIADGKNSNLIGQLLNISPLTVKAHRRNIIRKLGVNNSSELIKIVIAKGIL